MEKIIFDLNELILSLSNLSIENKPKFIKDIKAHFKIFKCNRNLCKRIKNMNSYSISDLGQLASMIVNYKTKNRYFTKKKIGDLEIELNPYIFESKPKLAIQIKPIQKSTDKNTIKLVCIKSSYDNEKIDAFIDIEDGCPNTIAKLNRHRIYKESVSKSSKNIYEEIIAYYFDIGLVVAIGEILDDIEEAYYNETKHK